MKVSRISTCLAAACIAAFPASVLAADSTLVLVMGGEAYDGPPKFEVDFDGKALGEGTVAAAIDTASTGRFADAGDKTPYVQTFTFAVPETAFKADGEVKIRFLNEAYGGDGSNHDRNLYLASVALNGRAVTASGLTTELAKGGGVPGEMLGEFLVIPDGTKDAVSKAPPGGWPAPTGAVATVAATVAPIPPADPATARVDVADLNQDPEGNSGACDLEQKYNVVGFNENSNELTPKLIARLEQVAADIGDRRCRVRVTGYASHEGALAENALFAVERAQNSLQYLKTHGVKFVDALATGVGATNMFGPDYRSNRRVVIIVTP